MKTYPLELQVTLPMLRKLNQLVATGLYGTSIEAAGERVLAAELRLLSPGGIQQPKQPSPRKRP